MAYLLAVLAGLCWGVGEVFTRAVLRTHEVSALAAIAVRTTVALPVLWAVWAVSRYGVGAESRSPLGDASAATVAKLVLGSGLVAGAAGMVFFYLALGLADVSRVKPIAFGLAPATAVVLGWLFLGEALTVPKVAGLALVVAGVLLITGFGH